MMWCAQAELKLLGIENVGLHNLSPGMVTTELLMSGVFLAYCSALMLLSTPVKLMPTMCKCRCGHPC